MLAINLCLSLQVGCVSEGETELNPSTKKSVCRQESSSYDRIPLVFSYCPTLRLSIRSSTYDYRETFRVPFSVLGPGMTRRIRVISNLIFIHQFIRSISIVPFLHTYSESFQHNPCEREQF